MVKNMVNDEGNWNLELLQNWLNVELVKCIIDIHSPPLLEDGVDRIGWGDYRDNIFSIANAYK